MESKIYKKNFNVTKKDQELRRRSRIKTKKRNYLM